MPKMNYLINCIVVHYTVLFLCSQELNNRLEEVAASEELVKSVNRELSGQMAEMVREFDEDKKQALEKYVL